jgi:hypothetical protein
MTDLGTLGGDNSEAIWLNDKGSLSDPLILQALRAVKLTMLLSGSTARFTISELSPEIRAAAGVA